MLPPRPDQRRPMLLFFLAGCAISVLSSLFFYAWFGHAAGAVFLRPGLLFSSVLGDGVGALLLLALLLPLRSVGAGPFWACGIGVVVVAWPLLSDLVSAALEHTVAGQAPAQSHWSLQDWFFSLLHTPDNWVLLTGSALLLALAGRLWPAPPAAGTEAPRPYRRSAAPGSAPLSIRALLFSFTGRLNRRAYLVAALALGLPNAILPRLAPAAPGLLMQILLFWPLLALATKRAHDRGHGTAWSVYMVALPGVFGILLHFAVALDMISAAPDLSTLTLVIAIDLLIAVPVLWASVELFFLRGTRGANRYGPDPLASFSPPAAPAPAPLPRPRPTVITPFASLPSRITAEAAARFRRRFRQK